MPVFRRRRRPKPRYCRRRIVGVRFLSQSRASEKRSPRIPVVHIHTDPGRWRQCSTVDVPRSRRFSRCRSRSRRSGHRPDARVGAGTRSVGSMTRPTASRDCRVGRRVSVGSMTRPTAWSLPAGRGSGWGRPVRGPAATRSGGTRTGCHRGGWVTGPGGTARRARGRGSCGLRCAGRGRCVPGAVACRRRLSAGPALGSGAAPPPPTPAELSETVELVTVRAP